MYSCKTKPQSFLLVCTDVYDPFSSYPRINFGDDKSALSNSETLRLVQELDSNKDGIIEGLFMME